MEQIYIAAALIVICALGAFHYVRKVRHGGCCCGEHAAPEKKVRVVDRDKSHYPFQCFLTIDGMTCANCVRRVENALNQLEGTWATVDLCTRQAQVYLKQQLDEKLLRQAVREAGYTVLIIKKGREL